MRNENGPPIDGPHGQTTRTGPGCLARLPEDLGAQVRDVTRVLLLHGRSSFEASGAATRLSTPETEAWTRFSNIGVNPELASVLEAAELYCRLQPEAVVAVGGGSVLDTAKAMLALAEAAGRGSHGVEEALGGRFAPPDPPPALYAAPTTAGSGSEATHFAVVYRDGVKHSLAHEALLPDYVYLDPELVSSCPPALAAASGADAVCQCVESWWNLNAGPRSRRYAEEGLGLLLPAFFAGEPEPMLTGANYAGRAINLTKTTAGHALSYGLTTRYGVPHGLAVLAVMQPLVRLMDAEHRFFAQPSVLDALFAPWGARFPAAFGAFAEAVWAGYPIGGYLSEAGSPPAAADAAAALSQTVNAERLGNHPVALTQGEIEQVYRAVIDRHAPAAEPGESGLEA